MKQQIRYACPMCGHSPLIRVHKDGNIICNDCNEPLLKEVNPNSRDRYIKCPNAKCGFDENINPRHGDKCPKCGCNIL